MASTPTNAIRQLNSKLNFSLTRTAVNSWQSSLFHTSTRRMFASNSSEKDPAGSNEVSNDTSLPSSPMQRGIWRDSLARDPNLPPKPPPGTYPHPFPEARDDPHSDSMRTHYQRPMTGTRAGFSPVSTSRATQRLNHLTGVGPKPIFVEPPKVHTPLYVIHVKSTPNNTIVSFHAPSTPKLPTTAGGGGKSKPSIKATPILEQPFSVGANPDEPPRQDTSTSTTVSTAIAVPKPDVAVPQTFDYTQSESTNRCIGWASGGSCHYKKVNRSTYEAGYDASVRIIRRIEEAFEFLASGGVVEDLPPMRDLKRANSDRRQAISTMNARGVMRIRVTYTGFGVGREAFNAAILSAEGGSVRGLIGQVQDKTPIKIGGCRGRKVRRV